MTALAKAVFTDMNDIPDGMMTAPCRCGQEGCSGWRVVPETRNPLLRMTREEFIGWYEKNVGGITGAVVECECGHKGCVGGVVSDG